MDAVFQKTRELGRALMESEAYLKMKAAEDKAMANEEAARAMGEFLEKRGELQAINIDSKIINGSVTADKSTATMGEAVALTDARNAFNALIGQINQVLQFIVTGEMQQPEGCSGSCASCSGCH